MMRTPPARPRPPVPCLEMFQSAVDSPEPVDSSVLYLSNPRSFPSFLPQLPYKMKERLT